MDALKDKVFNINFTRMFVANTLMCIGFYMLMPVLPVYAAQDLGLNKDKVGLILGVFAISSVIARPLAGSMLDRFGRMTVYIPAAVFFALCFGGYVLASTVVSLLAVRIVHGYSWGSVNTSSSTIVSDIVPAKLRGQGMGYFGLSMNIAMALGPALGVFLISHRVSTRLIFLMCMIMGLGALLFSAWVRPPLFDKERRPFSLRILFENRVLRIALLQFFFGFVYAGVMSYSTLYGLELNVRWLGLFFIVFAAFMAVFRPLAGKMMDKKGPTLLLTAGFSLFALGLVVLGLARDTLTFMLAGPLLGTGVGFIMPTVITMTINVVTASRRGAANATVFTAFDVGIGSGAIVLGVLAESFGYLIMYLISAGILILPAIWFFLFVLKRYNEMYKEING